MKIQIGIDEKSRIEIAHGLARVLANTQCLSMKARGFHWNVVGALFQSFHALFEQQYVELAEASDVIAERIRALGLMAPGSFGEFLKLSSVPDEVGVMSADRMLIRMLEGHGLVIESARSVLALAERAEDFVTVDMLTQRLQAHEKASWVLRSSLEK